MNIQLNIRRLLGALFILLFVACYANATLFVHTHIIDGETIIHSHVYDEAHTDESSEQDNQAHAPVQLELISYLNQILCEDNIHYHCNTDFTPYNYSEYKYGDICNTHIDYVSTHPKSLRAPPVVA